MTDTQDVPGKLVLEDGRSFEGRLVGTGGAGIGEVVFTTAMTGYQEVVTDPSFAGQVVVMTAPMMGNYGVSDADLQSDSAWVAGFVVRELSGAPGDGGNAGLRMYLESESVPVLHGCDTRAITRHIRDQGAMRAAIVPNSASEAEVSAMIAAEPPMAGRDLASAVGTSEPYTVAAVREPALGRVVCLDYGVKKRSLELLAQAGFEVEVLPAATSLAELLATQPDGVFVSSGPGDPQAVEGAVERILAACEKGVPVFGICLGCQLIARAFGGTTYKLPYGHRGGNHPVLSKESGVVEITSQNHGFAISGQDENVAGAPELTVTHVNLNDETVEGVRHRSRPVFGVQYHPESAPGPHDSRYLFRKFIDAMDANRAMASD
ncbi:MAG: glutamine-hydrolyzing carbamoyl-phosphate synthase small subunit [Gemmatimonadota bacterium]